MKRGLLFALALLACRAGAQEWRFHGGDAGGMKYSALKEIHRGNVNELKPAWIFHTGDVSDGSRWPVRSAFESTPIVVGDAM